MEKLATKAGQERIDRFLSHLEEAGINLHSLLIWQDGEIVHEEYRAPFTMDRTHRMYSCTKTFVSMAVGCLAGDGKIDLDDPIIRYFQDKLPEKMHPYFEAQTIRNMLEMRTATFDQRYWFQPGLTDRTKFYFSLDVNRPAGTLFDYDSSGSYILGCLVERVSGKKLLDFMKERFLDKIGGFESAELLATPDGTPWGDSAMICTPHALLNFAILIRNGGAWEGEQLVPAWYVKEAVSVRTTNDLDEAIAYNKHGYGYQVWHNERDGWSLHGMGGQYAICDPASDTIVVTTGDNQYNGMASEMLFRGIYHILLPEEKRLAPRRIVRVASGEKKSDLENRISGKTFICDENPMGIEWIRFVFDGDGLNLLYRNSQGDKVLRAGRGRNEFGYFPEYGYADARGNVHDITPFRLKCASSFGWLEEDKLRVFVQIEDRYFGTTVMTFAFKNENSMGFRFISAAEDFLGTYRGWGGANA